jgi:hypothetical protein
MFITVYLLSSQMRLIKVDDLILEDDLSLGIHIHKSIFEHFHKQFKNFILKGTNNSILSHYNARIGCVQVELVEFEK